MHCTLFQVKTWFQNLRHKQKKQAQARNADDTAASQPSTSPRQAGPGHVHGLHQGHAPHDVDPRQAHQLYQDYTRDPAHHPPC